MIALVVAIPVAFVVAEESWKRLALIAVVAFVLVVELLNTAGLARIVSFIGVGLLLLIIGYFAPLPPRRAGENPQEAKV